MKINDIVETLKSKISGKHRNNSELEWIDLDNNLSDDDYDSEDSDDGYEEDNYNDDYDEYTDDGYDEYGDDYVDDDYAEYGDDYVDDDYADDYDEDEYEEDSNRAPVAASVHALKDGITDWIRERSVFDFVAIGMGVLIMIVLVVAGAIFLKPENKKEKDEVTAEVSKEDSDSDKETMPALDEGDLVDEPSGNVFEDTESDVHQIIDEANDEAKTTVIMNLTSIKRDLKIKFIDNDNKSLVSGVRFKVSITDPSGNQFEKENDAADGVIYLTDLTAGAYKVALIGPEDDNLRFLKDPVTINVKDVIEYKKVDVSAEIKKESEIDAGKEDTGKNEAKQESENQDTVEWVVSSKTEKTDPAASPTNVDANNSSEALSENEFEEINKSDIADPSQSVKGIIESGIGKNGSQLFHALIRTEKISVKNKERAVSSESGDTLRAVNDIYDSTDVIEIDAGNEPAVSPKESPSPSENAAVSPTPSENTTETPSKSPDSSEKEQTPSASVTASETASATASETPSENASATPSTTPSETPQAKPSESSKPTQNHSEDDEDDEEDENLSPVEKAKKDTDSVLKTLNGYTVYVKDGDTFREAAFADYYTFDKFYVKKNAGSSEKTSSKPTTEGTPESKYTGWQTINGSTYYYDKNGNPVTGEQVIQGARYVFDSEGKLTSDSGVLGIDVSKWNGNIDWNAVKNSGVQYAIIRCGYRGSTEGALVEDSMFRSNLSGAKNAGIKVGVYFFTQATDEIEAIEEASMVVSLLGGSSLDYPVFLDVEPSGGRADVLSVEERTDICKAFCQTIANSGYKAGVYASKNWFTEKINTPALTNYTIWLSQYAATPTYTATRYDIWQYSSKGTISGISGGVDMNISFLSY